jgi:hypothetical protein
MGSGQAPVLETRAEIYGVSLARAELDVQTLLPPTSFIANATADAEVAAPAASAGSADRR